MDFSSLTSEQKAVVTNLYLGFDSNAEQAKFFDCWSAPELAKVRGSYGVATMYLWATYIALWLSMAYVLFDVLDLNVSGWPWWLLIPAIIFGMLSPLLPSLLVGYVDGLLIKNGRVSFSGRLFLFVLNFGYQNAAWLVILGFTILSFYYFPEWWISSE